MTPARLGDGAATLVPEAEEQAAGAAISLDDLVRVARRVWRSIVVWGLVGLGVGIAVALVRPKNYTARAAFVAEQSKLRNFPSGIAAIAAQFGLELGGGEADRSPQFYRQLIGTSGILRGLLDSSVAVRPGQSLSVRRLYRGWDGDSSRPGTDRLIRRLRKRISAQADPRTAVVTIEVAARTPLAAEGVAGLLIRSIKRFNVTERQLQARQRRIFLDQRVAEAQEALRQAEEELRRFYERNRKLADSPQLMFEESRMKRQIELRQQLYTTLSKELETARIEEVNDTPTITVIDPPFASSRPNGPGVLALALIGLALGIAARGTWLALVGR